MKQLRINKMSKLRHIHAKKPSAASDDKVSVCTPALKSAWTSGKDARLRNEHCQLTF